jgi:aminomethyltransferase
MNPTAESPTMQLTPLNECHRAAGARMVPFAGWEMPVHYGSAIEEHMATRRHCGLFDVSHMGQVFVTGPRAGELVRTIVSRDVSRLADGQQAYAVLCNAEGRLVDDLIAARLAEDRWLIVVNAATREGDVALMNELARPFGADPELGDQSDRWAMIAVQGPAWMEVCRAAIGEGEWESLPAFRIVETTYAGGGLIVSTTGYTGERGVELLCPPENAAALWNALVAGGGRPVGLAARDSLRLEMGYCLSGQDFTDADNPFEAGLAWVVDLDNGDFSGAQALREIKARGVERRLVGLLPEGRRIPRHGAAIVDANGNPLGPGGEPLGVITSGGWSPVLERPIAMGYVAIGMSAKGETVSIDLGGGKRIAAEVTRPPFLTKGGA